MNENISQYSKQIQNSQSPWVIVVTIVITALLTGGIVYTWQSLNLKSTEQFFQQQITPLQNQITQLQQQIDQIPQPQQQIDQLQQQITQLQQQIDQIPQPQQRITQLQQRISQTEQQIDQTEGIVYRNSKYGFTLTFPHTWKGYTAKNRIIDWRTFSVDSIDFGLPIQVQEPLFNISINTKSQWQQIKSKEKELAPAFLGESKQYIFGYDINYNAAVNEIIVARIKEILDIVKTFKIIE